MANKLGIDDFERLRVVEADYAVYREVRLSEQSFRLRFNLKHIRFLHRWLFQDVYDWAGEIRTIPMNKGGSEFAKPLFIEPEAVRVCSELRQEEKLLRVARADLPRRLAYYFAELNALHPFREGNGRTQRLFLRQLVELRGLTLAWSEVSAEQMVCVSIAAHQGQESPASALFNRILRRL